MIDSRTQLVGVISWPVEHSLSPVMHNAAFEDLGMNWRYVPFPVVPGAAADAARGLIPLGFRGANVTVPHKQDVSGGVDRLSTEAKAIGAINTLCVEGERGSGRTVLGHNTDLAGFLDGLERAGFDPSGERAVIVGAGGVARAAVYGLLNAGATDVTVFARTREKAERLTSDLDDRSGRLAAEPLTDEAIVEAVSGSALVVNTTPVGMWPETEQSVWPDDAPFPKDAIAYDLVYIPRRTKFLRQAAATGARCIEGLRMFVVQGARSFELWTGREPSIDVMTRACEAALGGGGT
jgi:shikimate dehydrogenase